MTMTPLATIADALIDFILSLLRDPAAAEEYQADPEGTLDRAGLGGACLADVRSVAPVIYDHPDVMVRPPNVYVQNPSTPHPTTPVERAISNIVNNFSIDNRATIVDNSVNQNVYAKGDVTQHFDNDAVVNTGDQGAAAGGEAVVDNSTTDVDGTLNDGTTTNNTTVTDSFNDNSTDNSSADTTVEDSFNDVETTTTTDTVVEDSFNDADVQVTEDAPPDVEFDDQP